jgi:DNA-binding LacI/PurR family transcriptional regulator
MDQAAPESLDPSNPTPLWAQLRDALRRRVESGEWEQGAMIPREVDLCAAYAVSRITAARAVQELVREGLLRRRRGRGTVVAARRRAAAPPALAFLAPRFDGDWTLDVYAGFEAVVAEAGYFALLTGAGGGPTLSAARIEALLAAHARGLAVSHLLLDDSARALLPMLRRDGVPLAFVGTYDPTVPCDRVVADNARAGRLATEHLLRLGHRRIAFLAPGASSAARSTSLHGRLGGYREAMHSVVTGGRGAPSGGSELLDALPVGPEAGARAERLLASLEASGATAAVATSDAVAVLVMRYLRAAGLRVPEHLALVGISDSRLAVMAEVPLTAVRIAAPDLGAGAARLLLRRLEGDASPPQEVVVPVELVVRASCGARMGDAAAQPYEPAHAAQDAGVALRAALDC